VLPFLMCPPFRSRRREEKGKKGRKRKKKKLLKEGGGGNSRFKSSLSSINCCLYLRAALSHAWGVRGKGKEKRKAGGNGTAVNVDLVVPCVVSHATAQIRREKGRGKRKGGGGRKLSQLGRDSSRSLPLSYSSLTPEIGDGEKKKRGKGGRM